MSTVTKDRQDTTKAPPKPPLCHWPKDQIAALASAHGDKKKVEALCGTMFVPACPFCQKSCGPECEVCTLCNEMAPRRHPGT